MWIDPTAIEDVWAINNRKENLGHIESLAESMRQNGYLPEYPIFVFEAANIPVETDKPYLMACGHHRRKAATAAGIDLILAEVHDSTEEEWIKWKVANEKPVSLNLIRTPPQNGFRLNSRRRSLKSPTGSPTRRGWVAQPLHKRKEAGVENPRARNIMRIRNLTDTRIILVLSTERLYSHARRSPRACDGLKR